MPASTQLEGELRTALEHAALVDLGAGSGGSLQMAMRTFGVPGVGLELLPNLVEEARARGLEVFRGDLFDLDPSLRFDYVALDNVLEHLPDATTVEAAIALACQVARRVVHIRHPSFDHMEYLEGLGVKQYWTDWPGVHTAPLPLRELIAMAQRAGAYRAIVTPVMRAVDTDDPTILPLDAPPNQHRRDRDIYGVYDPEQHGPKPRCRFERPVYFAFDLFVVIAPRLPVIRYRSDPETTQARAVVSWPQPRRRERLPAGLRTRLYRATRPLRRATTRP